MEQWEQLLMDTESLIGGENRVEFLEEAAELRRAEEATSSLASRLMGARGESVMIDLCSGERVYVGIQDCSNHWLRGVTNSGNILISLTAIACVTGLSAGVVGEFSGPVSRNMSFASAIRVFADKCHDVVVCAGGSHFVGRIMRVGNDCVDIVCSGDVKLLSFVAIDYISERAY